MRVEAHPHGPAGRTAWRGRGRAAGRFDAHVRRPFAAVMLAATLVLIPWVVLYVSRLPERHVIEHWATAWTGFDLVLAALLGATAWAAFAGRQIIVPILVATATMLACDAWFDVVTSWGTDDAWLSILTGAVVEVPLALSFLVLARRLVLAATAAVRPSTDGLPLRRIPLPDAVTRTAARDESDRLEAAVRALPEDERADLLRRLGAGG